MNRAEFTSVCLYQPAETGEVPKTLPWANRSEQEWKKDITKEEATRLFMLASINSPSQTSSPDQIPGFVDLWSLRTPFKVYWDSNVGVLVVDINRALDREKRKYPDDDFDNLAPSVAMLFEDSSFYHFLMVSRQIQRQRNTYKRHERSEPEESFSQQRADALKIDSHTLETLQQRYKDLVTIFYPLVHKYAEKLGKRSKLNNLNIDWDGIAGEGLSIAGLNFYWETMVIDPKWTVDTFLKTVYVYIKNPDINVFDTGGLQIKNELILDKLRSPNNTEEAALRNIGHDTLIRLIQQYTETQEKALIIYLKVNDDLSFLEIAHQIGRPERFVISTVCAFCSRLRRMVGKDPDIPVEVKKSGGGGLFGRLFENIEHYKELFMRNRVMLQPNRQRILDRFFTLQTGKRNSSIEAVWRSLQDEGVIYSVDTVRRRIAAGINQLDYKETPPGNRKDWNRRWANHQTRRWIMAISKNLNVWSTITERRKHILERYYLDDDKPTYTQIGKELGINQSTVSREIHRALIILRRLDTSPASLKSSSHKL